ncbi:MAG TPA: hypothetical protein DCP92_22955 [Nitrospiraceae bacterium]|jgi:hypothetical protein|nr:hypothetical protein [Nitrospiraceae bacterium]
MVIKSKSRFFFRVFFPIYLLVVFLSTSVLMISPASAGDNLYLTGILKRVNVKEGTIVVDVLSQSCPGSRVFSVNRASALQGQEEGKFSFSINSSSCKGSVIYKITSPIVRDRVRKKE